MSYKIESFLRRAKKIDMPVDVKAKFIELAGNNMVHTSNGNSRAAAKGEVAHFVNHNEKSKEGLSVYYQLSRKTLLVPSDEGTVYVTRWTISKDISLIETEVVFLR